MTQRVNAFALRNRWQLLLPIVDGTLSRLEGPDERLVKAAHLPEETVVP
jgi:hypothetical protein